MVMKLYQHFCIGIISLAILTNCVDNTSEKNINISSDPPVFQLLTAAETNINFENTLTEGLNTNVLMYEYFYNGGGVAVGDLNGDGLDDIYFTGNMVSNQLYLNKGSLKFEDITAISGAGGRSNPWKTGVTMADVNGDGKLDIFVCYSGSVRPESQINQLFINQGNNKEGIPIFLDMASPYGLASPSTTTQAVFFDYDRDGDMDMFLLNHNPKSLPILDEASTADILKNDDLISGARFFRQDSKNNQPFFTDITKVAGISSSPLSYGLGIGIADLNQDGWQDLYISNDYSVPDFLYINNQNGTFTNQIRHSIGHTSHSSMGNDIADFNNDGLPDIYTLDMLPEDNRRQKLLSGLDNYELFDFNVKMGFGHQYMRNMLQLNIGVENANGIPQFSEIGQLSGISNTDWSWAPLFADFDNDGFKDLYITNGNLRDFTNMDFVKFMGDNLKRKEGNVKREDVLEMVHKMPSSNIQNYLYKNNQGLTFRNVASAWGLGQVSNSGGAAYADLDNDGDLDLVVNNINHPAFIYRNDSNKEKNRNYLKVILKGDNKNTLGVGTKLKVYTKAEIQYLEQMPTRGYQSSVSPTLHFGLADHTLIDSLVVIWLSGKTEILKDQKVNQVLTLEEKNASQIVKPKKSNRPIFTETVAPIAYNDVVVKTNDFKRQPLMVNPLSFSGPCLVKGDINMDGHEDIFIGGGAGESGKLFLGNKIGGFTALKIPALDADRNSHDTDAAFFDANGDGFIDLYVSSGGYGNFLPEDVLLQSRLYLNNGKGQFEKASHALPKMWTSSSCVVIADFNGDSLPDIFEGGRVVPGRYPETPRSYILINNGKGSFVDKTKELAPELEFAGMVTDAVVVDLNNDKINELVIVGEWMPVSVYSISKGKLTNQTTRYFEKEYHGWWNKIAAEDLNGDGKIDLVLGNLGLNSQCKASQDQPCELIYKDFDDNGSVDPIMSFYIQGESYPYITRDEMLDQISIMRTRFQDYKGYADSKIKDIFTESELNGAQKLTANHFETSYFESTATGKFKEKKLPMEVQISPVYTITVLDFDKDGKMDLLLCGNSDKARLRFGKYDANYGVLLKGNGKGDFKYVPQGTSGFYLTGDVRSVIQLKDQLIFGINQKELKTYQMK